MTSKRRKGFNSETHVKRGYRSVKGGEKELVEKLGRNDLCPCGSGKSFQEMLPQIRALSMGPIATNTGGNRNLSTPSLTDSIMRWCLYHGSGGRTVRSLIEIRANLGGR
ncbi:MAG: SEC-C metal-binding domain-containing protein [Pseudomonadota bacterium]